MKTTRIIVAALLFFVGVQVDAATAFRTAGSNTTPASPLAITPGASANDVMIEAVITDTNTATTFTYPTSFTQLINTVTGSSDGGALAVAYNKQATGSEGSLSTSNSPSQNIIGAIASFSGVDNTTPLDVTPPAAVVQATTIPNPLVMTSSITPVTNGAMIVAIRLTDVTASQANAITCSTTAGTTGAWTSLDYNSGFYNVSICYAQQTTAGALTVSTTNGGSVSAAGVLYVLALRPATGGTTIGLVAGSAAFTGSTPTVTLSGNKTIPLVAGSAAFTGSTQTAAITNYTWYTLPAPGGYDNNSILTGQTYPTGSILRVVTDFGHITANYAVGPLQNDINNYATAQTGYTGSDSATYEIKNTSGTTSQYTITADIDFSSVIGFSAGSMAYTGSVRSITIGTNITPVAGSATFTGAVPTVTINGNTSIGLVAGSATFTGAVPTVVASNNITIAPVAGAAVFTGSIPNVINGANGASVKFLQQYRRRRFFKAVDSQKPSAVQWIAAL